MKERPILFSSSMVNAILDGRKTQTRRVINPQRTDESGWLYHDRGNRRYAMHASITGPGTRAMLGVCPYGGVGDRLWVRESFALVPRTAYAASAGVQQTLRPDDDHDAAIYAAGWDRSPPGTRWRPSIHMPRWASRITLDITGVRVERVQDISLDDMRAEGVRPDTEASLLWRETLAENFRDLWDEINAKRGYAWASNPWVWVIEFRRLD